MDSTTSKFVGANVRALPRSQRIAEEIWEKYRADIIREFKSGGGTGNAQALKWILSQDKADFKPNAKQLRHRIKVVWGEETAIFTPSTIESCDLRDNSVGPSEVNIQETSRQDTEDSKTLHPVTLKNTDSLFREETQKTTLTPNLTDQSIGQGNNNGDENSSGKGMVEEYRDIVNRLSQEIFPKEKDTTEMNGKQFSAKDVTIGDMHGMGAKSLMALHNILHESTVYLDSYFHDEGYEEPNILEPIDQTKPVTLLIQDSDRLQGFPYVAYTEPRRSGLSSVKRTIRPRMILKSLTVSALRGIPEEMVNAPSQSSSAPTTSTTFKRRAQGIDLEMERHLKRHKDKENTGRLTTAMSAIIKEVTESRPIDEHHQSVHVLPETSTLKSLTSALSVGKVEDSVLEPRRLQELLASIGIHLLPGILYQCVRKDVVFRPSVPPVGASLLALSLASESIKTIKAFAESLFASSHFGDAFPLFFLVWILRRGNYQYAGAKLLIPCARSAVRQDDRVLIRCLLEHELSILRPKSSEIALIRSLICLELASIIEHEGDKTTSTEYRTEAQAICPAEFSIMQRFHDTQQYLLDSSERDLFDSYIFKMAYIYCASESLVTRPESVFEKFDLRDALLIRIQLGPHGSFTTAPGQAQLRDCIEKAARILQRPYWSNSHHRWLEMIAQHWPECPRSTELAIFLDLLRNWWTRPSFCGELEMHHENSLVGISTVEIISVLAFIVVGGNYLHVQSTFYDSFEDQSIGEHDISQDVVIGRALAILELPYNKLLLGFLWCSVKLNRKRTSEGLDPNTSTDMCKDLITDIFNQSVQEERSNMSRAESIQESVMTDVSANPTLAASLSTGSTLSSMRRQSRMTYASSMPRWSNRTITIDDLAERSSLLTISDGAHSRPVSPVPFTETVPANTEDFYGPDKHSEERTDQKHSYPMPTPSDEENSRTVAPQTW